MESNKQRYFGVAPPEAEALGFAVRFSSHRPIAARASDLQLCSIAQAGA